MDIREFRSNEGGVLRIIYLDGDEIILMGNRTYRGKIYKRSIKWVNDSPTDNDKIFCDRILNLLVFA